MNIPLRLTGLISLQSKWLGHRQSKSVLCLVTQSFLTLCNPMDCSPPGTSIHWDSPGKNTGSGCHALFQGIFPIQGSNPGLLNCRQILYCLIYFQHHNLKVSVLQRSAFSKIQLSHLYMTNGKTVALTIWTFVSKLMSLLYNMLSRVVIAFLPRGNYTSIIKGGLLWLSYVKLHFYLRGILHHASCPNFL